jgi:hypothetical protein
MTGRRKNSRPAIAGVTLIEVGRVRGHQHPVAGLGLARDSFDGLCRPEK